MKPDLGRLTQTETVDVLQECIALLEDEILMAALDEAVPDRIKVELGIDWAEIELEESS